MVNKEVIKKIEHLYKSIDICLYYGTNEILDLLANTFNFTDAENARLAKAKSLIDNGVKISVYTYEEDENIMAFSIYAFAKNQKEAIASFNDEADLFSSTINIDEKVVFDAMIKNCIKNSQEVDVKDLFLINILNYGVDSTVIRLNRNLLYEIFFDVKEEVDENRWVVEGCNPANDVIPITILAGRIGAPAVLFKDIKSLNHNDSISISGVVEFEDDIAERFDEVESNFKFSLMDMDIKPNTFLNFVKSDFSSSMVEIVESENEDSVIKMHVSLSQLRYTNYALIVIGFESFSNKFKFLAEISKDLVANYINKNYFVVDGKKEKFKLIGSIIFDDRYDFDVVDVVDEMDRSLDYSKILHVILEKLNNTLTKKLAIINQNVNLNMNSNEEFLILDKQYLTAKLMFNPNNYENDFYFDRFQKYNEILKCNELNESYITDLALFKEIADFDAKLKDTKLADTLNTIQISSIILTILGWLLVIFQSSPSGNYLYIAIVIVFTIVALAISICIQKILSKRL